MRAPVYKTKPCNGCGIDFVPATFRMRYCDPCRGSCAAPGCTAAVKARGFCGMHLWRLDTHGEPGKGEHINERQSGACSVEGCNAQKKSKGFCGTHYWRVRKHGDPGAPVIPRKRRGVPCEVDGCVRPAEGDGLCRMHYERRRNSGEVGGPEAMRRMPGEGHISKSGYKVIGVDGEIILEHRAVMEKMLGRKLVKGETVHHRDGRRAFNDPSNLELWWKGQPAGQRVKDLIQYVAENHAEEVMAAIAAKKAEAA